MNYKILSGIAVIGITIISLNYFSESNKLENRPTQLPSNEAAVNLPESSPIRPALSHEKEELKKVDLQAIEDVALNNRESSDELVIAADSFSEQFVVKDKTTDKEVLSRSSVDNFFIDDISKALTYMEKVDYSEDSQLRKDTLEQFIIDELKDVQIFDQKSDCAGKVCIIEMTYSSNSDNESINKLSNFAKNYAFESFKTNENGDNVLKAIYIATDDPSQLSFEIN
ncbi:hypothetical protein [Pseudoalteromonas sp. TB64]|uniref:hypothetical protein n=1 Tax=Pseudoalteromonas sp. TB64 TaxID=1938600 RepID=UPI00040F1229|nr:hypothetical protein [Pseudoalteromonas sp. TB64]